ncbi:hypothetical protein V7T21_02240 [Segatella copri]|uniref:hypothetical protein n=1 Tax=Segatella copri TaxID=165179 RepID=UPI002FF2D85F
MPKNKILYPIKRKYVKRIFDGTKAYEYRKHLCREEVDTIVIYESSGRGMVVGECKIVDRICCDPVKLWEKTKELSGMEEKEFFNYFRCCKNACAYVLGDVNIFLKPKSLKEYDINFVPQNYVYL